MAVFLSATFVVSYFLHLTARFPVLGTMRADLLVGGAALIAVLLQSEGNKFRLEMQTSRRLRMFLLYVLLTIPFVTWPGSVVRTNLVIWVKAVFFFVLIVGAVRTERQLKFIVGIFLLCQFFRVLEPLYLHVTQGYWGDIAYSHATGTMTSLVRLSGAPHDVVNANQYAWVIVNTVPFLFYLMWKGKRVSKLLFLALLPVFLYAMVLTGSRSGLIALMAVILGIVAFSAKRMRNLVYTGLLFIPLLVYLVSNAGADLQDRYLSIVDSSVAGSDTRMGRLNALERQITSISNNPLFGNGLGTSAETNHNVLGGRAQLTHNLYVEVLQETGLLGFLLFIWYVVSVITCLWNAMLLCRKEETDTDDWLARLIAATLVWACMDLVYSISCFGLSSWEWYFFGAVSTVAYALVLERKTNEKSANVGVDSLPASGSEVQS